MGTNTGRSYPTLSWSLLMKNNGRAAVAYIAGRLVSRKNSSHVYTYADSKFLAMSGTVTPTMIQIYDHTQPGYISGSGNGKTFSLFNYGEGSHLTLSISGTQFQGYDYGTGSHFSGYVNDRSISLYDYREQRHFNYTI